MAKDNNCLQPIAEIGVAETAISDLKAGRVLDPNIDDIVDVGLPFGPKPRLVLYHLNAEAIRTQSPVLHLEDSLTASNVPKLDAGGRTIKSVKQQLNVFQPDFRFKLRRPRGQ